MDATLVFYTRSEFNQQIEKLSDETAWELRSRQDAFGTVFRWAEANFSVLEQGTHPSGGEPLLITVFLVYQPDFRVPQLGFFTSSLLSLDDLRAALPSLSFMNVVLETSSGVDAVSTRPLVSCSWSDEAQQHMWLVHPCDTGNLLRRGYYSGARGDVLHVFLTAMTAYFPLPPPLLTPA